MIVGTPYEAVSSRAVLAFDALRVGAHHAIGRVPLHVDQIQEISGRYETHGCTVCGRSRYDQILLKMAAILVWDETT